MALELNDKGYVNMDDMIAFIDALPEVQQQIIASHMNDKVAAVATEMGLDCAAAKKTMDQMVAFWMYS